MPSFSINKKKMACRRLKQAKLSWWDLFFKNKQKPAPLPTSQKSHWLPRGISIVFKEMFSKNLVMVFSIAQWSKRTGVMPRTLNEHLKKDMTFTLSALVFEAVWFSKTCFQSTLQKNNLYLRVRKKIDGDFFSFFRDLSEKWRVPNIIKMLLLARNVNALLHDFSILMN